MRRLPRRNTSRRLAARLVAPHRRPRARGGPRLSLRWRHLDLRHDKQFAGPKFAGVDIRPRAAWAAVSSIVPSQAAVHTAEYPVTTGKRPLLLNLETLSVDPAVAFLYYTRCWMIRISPSSACSTSVTIPRASIWGLVRRLSDLAHRARGTGRSYLTNCCR